MAERTRCEDCDRTFKDIDGLTAHNKAKHPEEIKKVKKKLPLKKIRNWGIFIAVVVVIIGSIVWGILGIETLPPVSARGHIEVNPESHVLRVPMQIEVQKHMLEHADGVGPPGIIINYNCKDYKCESGLIEDLEAFAVSYPDNVYVAPFKNMDAKIALTRHGKIEILEEFDEERIDEFIGRR